MPAVCSGDIGHVAEIAMMVAAGLTKGRRCAVVYGRFNTLRYCGGDNATGGGVDNNVGIRDYGAICDGVNCGGSAADGGDDDNLRGADVHDVDDGGWPVQVCMWRR